jgi:hypothetical protein
MQNNCIQFTIKFVCLRLTLCLRFVCARTRSLSYYKGVRVMRARANPNTRSRVPRQTALQCNSLHKTAYCPEVCQ